MIITRPTGLGAVVQNVPDLPPELVHQLGASWVVMVWGPSDTPARAEQLVKRYEGLKGNMMVCGTVERCRIARGMGVIPIPRNEPDQNSQEPMPPEEMAIIVRQLASEGVVAGPDSSTLDNHDYNNRFMAEMGQVHPAFIQVVHAYGRTPATLPKPLIYTEANPEQADPTKRAAYVLELKRLGLTAAFYQLPTTENPGATDGFAERVAGVWRLNKAGQILATGIASQVVN